MNILITGIHGFVGTNLVRALKSEHRIYGLDIVTPSQDGVEKTFGWNELDLLPSIDVIIHLAGKAHDTKNQTIADIYYEINTGLTQKIYDFYRSSSATKFIFFSSVKAAADSVDGVLTEDVVPMPIGPYGESKIMAEKYILSNLTAVPDKKVYIFRPAMIHGPGNKGNLNLLYNVVSKGIPYPLGAFENKRSFCSIDNLSFIIHKMLETTVDSGIYNICDDQTVSTNELIAVMCDVMNKPKRIWSVNRKMIEVSAAIGSVLHLPFNSHNLKKLTENYVVSNQKMKKVLGIDELPVSAMDGLRETISNFKQ